MKGLITLILFCLSHICTAQYQCTLSKDSLSNYFHSRLSGITNNILDHVLQGDFTPYKTDDFTFYYAPDDLEGPKDNVYIPLGPIKAITFITNQAYSAEPGGVRDSLIGISLHVEYSRDSMKPGILVALCYLKWIYIQEIISIADKDFLLYYYGLLKQIKRPAVIINPDEILMADLIPDYHKTIINRQILDGRAYYQSNYNDADLFASLIESSLYEHLNGISLTDRKSNQPVPLRSILYRYSEDYIKTIPEYFTGEFMDTIIVNGYHLGYDYVSVLKGCESTIDSVILTGLYTKQSNTSYMLPWPEVKRNHPYPWMVWFIEDYYRHQLKN